MNTVNNYHRLQFFLYIAVSRFSIMLTTSGSSGEAERLEALNSYHIVDSLTEKDYDDITFIASLICNTPISLISFVEKERQWFKSGTGTTKTETPREYSFCAHSIGVPDRVLVVNDARADERFKTNPLVTGDPNIVFYAGAPIVTSDGHGLGSVCVLDTAPREISQAQAAGLQKLADQVMRLLEQRKKQIDVQAAQLQTEIRNKDLEQFAMIVAHDIKSPLSSIVVSNQMLEVAYAHQLDTTGQQMVAVSARAARKISSMVDNILSYYKDGAASTHYTSFDLVEMLDSVASTIVSPKEYRVAYHHESTAIYMNRVQLEQIFFNLINNSIRYNNKPVAKITIRFFERDDSYHFVVTDNGIGIPTEKQDKIFNLFTTASTADVFGVTGHGIGLPSVKKIVEYYSGSISVASEVDMGTVISFTLQKPPSSGG